jgi:hypothetical protein
MEVDHAPGQLASQFVNARNQGFEVVAIFDAGVFGDLLQSLAFEPIRFTRRIV